RRGGLVRVAPRGGDPRRVRLRGRGARAARLPRDHHAGARLHTGCRREEGRRLHRPVRARLGARLLPALRHAVAGGAAARPPWPLMVETLQNLALGFSIALTPGVLFYAFAGCVVGTLVGVLPGIGPLAGISLLLPATFGLDATRAIVMLAGIYYGAMYGGSTTSILMRIPGEAASVMTCIDGYAMARKGRAGAPLAIAAVGSYVAGTASLVGLMALAPPLATLRLRFGQPAPPEVIKPCMRELLPTRQEWRESGWPIARGTVLGFLIGILPGSAHIIASFVSYAVEKRWSRHPEQFGHGAVAGVAGPESA